MPIISSMNETTQIISSSVGQIGCLLNALQCGGALLDGDRRFVSVNDRFCQMMKRSRGQLVGRRLHEFYSAEADVWFERARGKSMEAWEDEFYLPAADGAQVPVLFGSRPLDVIGLDGRYVVVTVIDLTMQKEMYADVSKLTDTVLAQALDLKRYSQKLEQRVAERTVELHEANMEAITMLAIASEARDSDTGQHVQRIRRYAERLAEEAGLGGEESRRIGYSAILHDVGKMHIPDDILKKPGKLTEDERKVMQRHTTVGESILSTKPFFEMSRRIARAHHENWDGTGYPDGLKGEAIDLAARIVHVVDVYDALSMKRVYKEAWTMEQSVGAIMEGAGTQFDPALVEAFGRLHRRGGLQG